MPFPPLTRSERKAAERALAAHQYLHQGASNGRSIVLLGLALSSGSSSPAELERTTQLAHGPLFRAWRSLSVGYYHFGRQKVIRPTHLLIAPMREGKRVNLVLTREGWASARMLAGLEPEPRPKVDRGEVGEDELTVSPTQTKELAQVSS